MDMANSLRESESKFRTLTESTASGIFIVQNDRFKYLNRAGEEITGYTLEELEGEPFLKVIHPHYRDVVIERAQAHLTDENSIDVSTRYEFKFVRKDGGPTRRFILPKATAGTKWRKSGGLKTERVGAFSTWGVAKYQITKNSLKFGI